MFENIRGGRIGNTNRTLLVHYDAQQQLRYIKKLTIQMCAVTVKSNAHLLRQH